MAEASVISETCKKVFIVEDHPVFREGMVQILNAEKGLAVCGEAGDADEALRAVPGLKPDLVLVDLTIPGKSGLELIKELRASRCLAKVLVISMHDEALYADRVLRAGGDGYIMKQEDPEEIVCAVQDVLAGRIYVSEAVIAGRSGVPAQRPAEARTRRFEQLSDAELELLRLLGQGKANAEIARQLHLSTRTVSARGSQIRKKLQLKTANELIRYAVCWVETGAV
jgi:DNA-binding NarL/FixJ family response regulator